ncbi:HNH endonuclease [Nocardia sp. GAS34]|uniref:HNH endonuclease n=1 Tax=unclassified Nocardia TaxID=2637762 RepID=UPI003D20924C
MGNELSASEMRSLYTGQLVRRDTPARAHYDKIILAAPYGLCCYCQYGEANTIDHFIPKTHVPALAIDGWNLMPCCGKCNHTLLDFHSDKPEKQLLHPYAMPALGRWLRARVIEQVPVVLQFTAEPEAGLTEILQQRILNEFEALHLGERYAIVAAEQISTTNRTLSRRWGSEDHETVRAHLREQALDEAGPDVNDRRAVVYEALADSDWYCQGGFLT